MIILFRMSQSQEEEIKQKLLMYKLRSSVEIKSKKNKKYYY